MQRENAQLRDQLARAELLIGIQKNSRRCWSDHAASRVENSRDRNVARARRDARRGARECGPRGAPGQCVSLAPTVGPPRERDGAALVRTPSPRALSPATQDQVLAYLRDPRFVDRAPAQVHATLLDEGTYVCSVRTMYRLLATTRGSLAWAAVTPVRQIGPRWPRPPSEIAGRTADEARDRACRHATARRSALAGAAIGPYTQPTLIEIPIPRTRRITPWQDGHTRGSTSKICCSTAAKRGVGKQPAIAIHDARVAREGATAARPCPSYSSAEQLLPRSAVPKSSESRMQVGKRQHTNVSGTMPV